MIKIIMYSLLMASFGLTACSGGGGSSGGAQAPSQPTNSSYSLEWNESHSGSVSGLPADLTNIALGTVITLDLTIPTGFKLDHWTGACEGSTTQCQLTVSDNITAGVILVPLSNYLLNITQPSFGGTISQTLSGTVFLENTFLTLYANAADGFKFKKWTDNCSTQLSDSCSLTFTTNMTVSAEFECQNGKVLNGSVCQVPGI